MCGFPLPPEVVALQQIEDAPDSQTATAQLTDGGTATAHWSASVGQAVLVTTGLPALADDQAFEMWFVRDGQAVSAGTFEPGAGGEATALLDGTVQEGDTIIFDTPARRLDVDLTDEEIARRLANWTPPRPKHTFGVMAKYAALVSQANDGAITRVGLE